MISNPATISPRNASLPSLVPTPATRRGRRCRQRGAANVLLVIGISTFLLAILAGSFLAGIRASGQQSQAQLRQDLNYRQEAFLAALIHLVPNLAIKAMQPGSTLSTEDCSWEGIFEKALELSDSRQVLDATLVAGLGLGANSISGNTATGDFESGFTLAAPGGDGPVLPGNLANLGLISASDLAAKLPATLNLPSALVGPDATIPLISPEKAYHPLDTKGLSLSADAYSRFNVLAYPDIRFGYRVPGSPFVAKRNWWLFTTRSRVAVGSTGFNERHYVISIYEVPSQVPLSASGKMQLGRQADGSDWSSIDIQGPVYGGEIEALGPFTATEGSLAARRSISLEAPAVVDGQTLQEGFDQLGIRESREREKGVDFYAASVSGNERARSVFVDINPGKDFLYRSSGSSPGTRVSPTEWETYSRGANQAAMRANIVAVNPSNQLPTTIEFHYVDTGGYDRIHLLERGDNWNPTPEGETPTVPFDTDILENGQSALVVSAGDLPAFLQTLPGAADSSVNHSLLIEHDPETPDVILPTIPSEGNQLAVALRRCEDFTAFEKGFALVTPCRVYFVESFNQVSKNPPDGSGLPADEPYYPPVAVFSPEKRFGGMLNVPTPVHLQGRLSALNSDSEGTGSPLDLKGIDNEEIGSDILSASLVAANSPASIPPIHFLYWLVTIEEVHP